MIVNCAKKIKNGTSFLLFLLNDFLDFNRLKNKCLNLIKEDFNLK